MGDGLFATTRVFTGIPVARGYVMDRSTGKIIAACEHRHRSRLRSGGKNAQHYALECATKLLRRIRKASDEWRGRKARVE